MRHQLDGHVFIDLQVERVFPVHVNVLRFVEIIGKEIELGSKVDILGHVGGEQNIHVAPDLKTTSLPGRNDGSAGIDLSGIDTECAIIGQPLVVDQRPLGCGGRKKQAQLFTCFIGDPNTHIGVGRGQKVRNKNIGNRGFKALRKLRAKGKHQRKAQPIGKASVQTTVQVDQVIGLHRTIAQPLMSISQIQTVVPDPAPKTFFCGQIDRNGSAQGTFASRLPIAQRHLVDK